MVGFGILSELAVADEVASVVEAVRHEVGIRVEAAAVPARSLPRFELKARRLLAVA